MLDVLSRYGSSLVHGAACGYSMLRDRLHDIGVIDLDCCRRECE